MPVQYQEHMASKAEPGASPAVYDSLLNVSQAGAGYNTQLGVAMSLSEVIAEISISEQ